MDRRHDPRFETSQEATITLLGDHPVSLPARVENLSGRGMRVIVDRKLLVSSPVRVDLNHSILLGEVCYVEQDGDRFAVGLVLDQVLHETPELKALIAAISDEAGQEVDAGVETRTQARG